MAGKSRFGCSEVGAPNKPRSKPIEEMPAIYASDAIPEAAISTAQRLCFRSGCRDDRRKFHDRYGAL